MNKIAFNFCKQKVFAATVDYSNCTEQCAKFPTGHGGHGVGPEELRKNEETLVLLGRLA